MSLVNAQLNNIAFLVSQLQGHASAGGQREHVFNLHVDSEHLAVVEAHLERMVNAMDAEIAEGPPKDT